jgi:hypothetical protein
MGKQRFRRQVSLFTFKDERITIGYVASNGGSIKNARAKGCFGYNDPYTHHTKKYWKKHGRRV